MVDVPSRLQEYSEYVGTFRQFSDIKAEGPYIVEGNRVPREWPHNGNVEFKSLSVKYGADQNYALKNLNLTIRPGEKIGIVGRTGAGKSTLAKAIFRLLNENVEGSIEIDGCDTAKFGVGDFRPKLGIIPQESTMFIGTVRRNLDPLHEFTIEDMWAAMIKCGVAELIEPERKRKPIGVAKKSSNGQQQLFSLCRLLMRKRKVLVLDEATADVDQETDRKMQELIRSEFSDCTVLTIAHRLDTIMNSDRIIVMEKGEIAEIGPPQELIANGGMFAELVKANAF
ncbi:ATP-binding cassette glutathione S-conjugate transporter ycf1 [Coemansia pectinata]|uniref:ATP-binding cassette glutathione S-conjugate transporter ycf1 n=1 Tax=Coemansia pectinata TaxID=1052879 RepID=A0A9W8LCI8_9FUNG|nr:ATP-binding cassette glutathione S-conjugate transporter ycf1 [Coemansia pectinata]